MATRRPADEEAGPAERRRRRLDPAAVGAADADGSAAAADDDDDSVDEDDEAQLDAISRDMKASIDRDLVQRAIERNQRVRWLADAPRSADGMATDAPAACCSCELPARRWRARRA